MVAHEVAVILPCLAIPRPEVLPLAEKTWLINIALLGHNVVRFHEQAVLTDALQSLGEATSRIDHPGCTLLAQLLDHLPKSWMKNGRALWIDQSAIEVETEDESGLPCGHELGVLARNEARRNRSTSLLLC